MKKINYSCLFILFFLAALGSAPHARAQDTPSGAKGKTWHRIEKGDTWYSVARKFGVTYADLRQANPTAEETLHPGDSLRVPATVVLPKPVIKEKTHVVRRGETLSSIASRYGVKVQQLVDWNHLGSKSIQAGKKLIVGRETVAPKTAQVAPAPAPARRDSVSPPSPRNDTATATASRDSGMTKKQVTASRDKSKETTFSKGREEVSEEGAVAWIQDPEISPGKYFALHRTAPTGTIIRVTNKMNRRIVFVKVVGRLPDTGDNGGILMKISKAAAEKLGVIDSKFQAELSWGIEKP